jgi:hypothetical protein
MADDDDQHSKMIAPSGVQIVSLPTPFHVQQAVSDAFTQAMRTLVVAHELQPKQIIAGVVKWTWDYAQRNGWSTNELGQYCANAWTVWNQTRGAFNREAVKS